MIAGLDTTLMERKFGKDWTWASLCKVCGKAAGQHYAHGGDCPPMTNQDEVKHCGHEDAEDLAHPHDCPYDVEITHEMRLCTCCEGCAYQCAQDV